MSRKKARRSADTSFYVQPSDIGESSLVLVGDNYHHAINVLRQEVGAAIEVVDGQGCKYIASIEKIESGKALCSIASRALEVGESQIRVTIGVGMMHTRDRFETLVEKVVELGAVRVCQLDTDNSTGRPARYDRIMRIAVAAMKQSRRSRLIELDGPSALSEFVSGDDSSGKYFCSMNPEARALNEVLEDGVPSQAVSIVVGPEGGLSTDEEAYLSDSGYVAVNLGVSRLRTETAAIAAVSIIQQRGIG